MHRFKGSSLMLGATLSKDHRTLLNQLALDLVFNSLLSGRLERMRQGSFPSAPRDEAAVVVKWDNRRVRFREVRRVSEADEQSVYAWGAGRIFGILSGVNKIEAIPGKLGWPAEIDASLAARMPEPDPGRQRMTCMQNARWQEKISSAPGAPERRYEPPAELGSISALAYPALVRVVLRAPAFRRLCEGTDVPPPLLRRNRVTDARLFGPDGVVPWNDASLISEVEMNALGVELANRAYTLLLGLAEGRIGVRDEEESRPEDFDPGLLPVDPGTP